MTGTELPTAAPRPPSRSAEALSRAEEAGGSRSVAFPSKCSRGRSLYLVERKLSQMDIESTPIRTELNG